MNWRWLPSDQYELDRLAQQHRPWPRRAAIHHIEVDPDNQLVLVLRLLDQSKSDVALASNTNCTNCNGEGYVRYWYDQDDSRAAKCPQCFPNDVDAKRHLEEWLARGN